MSPPDSGSSGASEDLEVDNISLATGMNVFDDLNACSSDIGITGLEVPFSHEVLMALEAGITT